MLMPCHSIATYSKMVKILNNTSEYLSTYLKRNRNSIPCLQWNHVEWPNPALAMNAASFWRVKGYAKAFRIGGIKALLMLRTSAQSQNTLKPPTIFPQVFSKHRVNLRYNHPKPSYHVYQKYRCLPYQGLKCHHLLMISLHKSMKLRNVSVVWRV